MISIYIDKKKYQLYKNDNLLKSCLSLGIDIPYFCWHPALGSIGSCRQCAVKRYMNVNDKHGQIIMSCMSSTEDGMHISVMDEESKNFRKYIAEFLMINHPHDCPICAEGGNCHLQDMIVMTGHNIRRYRFSKRVYTNQYLGPFITHEMNRCITCYRCVRFYKNYAGGNDLGVYGIRNNIYFGRERDGRLKNEFSGNLVEICPTGVFSDKILSNRYSRKWDMQFSPSICHQCCIGCNISPGERYGEIRKIDNRYNGSVNHYFLCDRGRFGYDYVNMKNRPKQPIKRKNIGFIKMSIDQIVQSISNLLINNEKLIGIGSPRASVESNFMLRKLVGKNNFYSGISKRECTQINIIIEVLKNSGIYSPNLREIENYDAILILGEDLTQTGPRMALSVRQAIMKKLKIVAEKKGIPNWNASAIMNVGRKYLYPLFITNISSTKLDDIAKFTYFSSVNDQARFGFSIANIIDNTAPKVKDIDSSILEKAKMVAKYLINARNPLIISGTSSGSKSIIESSVNIAISLKKIGINVGISFIVESVNSIGLGMIVSKDLDDALCEIENNRISNIIILENDIYRYAPAWRINSILNKIKNIVVMDHQNTNIFKIAKFILPSSSFAEGNGTVINNEGRAQRFFQVYNPSFYNKKVIMLDSWKWLYAIYSKKKFGIIKWINIDFVIDLIAKTLIQFSGIKNVAPNSKFRVHGKKFSRSPNRCSGRSSIQANINVHETSIQEDLNTMFTFSMEGDNSPKSPRQHIAFAWYPGWNSYQAWNKFQDEIGGHLYYGDPGIRLFQSAEKIFDYFYNIPNSSYKERNNKYFFVAPFWHLFGSEEMSQKSKIIQKVMLKPYAIMNSFDAKKLNLKSGSRLRMICCGLKLNLPVKFNDILCCGNIGLPIGYPNIPTILSGKKIFITTQY